MAQPVRVIFVGGHSDKQTTEVPANYVHEFIDRPVPPPPSPVIESLNTPDAVPFRYERYRHAAWVNDTAIYRIEERTP